MTEQAIYQKVYELAFDAHQNRALRPENRFRKGTGIPYITHPVAVKDIAIQLAREKYFGQRETFLVSLIAILHDVLEDTDVTVEELRSFLLTMLSLGEVSYIMEAVQLLTKDPEDFNIIMYLNRIRHNPFASVVKLSDLQHNMSDLKPGNLLDKYRLCHYFLTQ